MTPINFKASFLKTVYIPQKVSGDKYKDTEVSIVELDKNDKKDIEALGKTACKWENIASGYAFCIYNDAVSPRMYSDVLAERYLALTKQNQDYKNLDSDKILGLASFFEKDAPEDEIAWLQVNPSTSWSNSLNRSFKKIGTSLVDYMKGLTDKSIYVQADDDAIDFYLNNDFHTKDVKHPSKLYWW